VKIREQLDQLMATGKRIPMALYMLIESLGPVENYITMSFDRFMEFRDETARGARESLVIIVSMDPPRAIDEVEYVFRGWKHYRMRKPDHWQLEFYL